MEFTIVIQFRVQTVIDGRHDIQHTTFSIMTFSIMTFSIMIFSIMTFSIMIFSIMTFSIMTFSIMTLSIMKLSIVTFDIMTLIGMIRLTIPSFSVTNKKLCHSALHLIEIYI